MPETPVPGTPVPETEDSRAELLMTAAEGALDQAGRARLDALRVVEPGVDAEIAELATMLGSFPSLGGWDDSAPSAGLRERVVASATPAIVDAPAHPSPDGEPNVRLHRGQARHSRRLLPAIIAAAACLVVGVAGRVAIGASLDRTEPGTLGAVEHIEFVADDDRTQVDGDLVAHTWGTETLFEAEGLEAGATYSVVLVEEDGDIVDSGTFLGTDGTVTCRMNAGVLRAQVAEVRILQASHVVASAELPPVD